MSNFKQIRIAEYQKYLARFRAFLQSKFLLPNVIADIILSYWDLEELEHFKNAMFTELVYGEICDYGPISIITVPIFITKPIIDKLLHGCSDPRRLLNDRDYRILMSSFDLNGLVCGRMMFCIIDIVGPITFDRLLLNNSLDQILLDFGISVRENYPMAAHHLCLSLQ